MILNYATFSKIKLDIIFDTPIIALPINNILFLFKGGPIFRSVVDISK